MQFILVVRAVEQLSTPITDRLCVTKMVRGTVSWSIMANEIGLQ